MDEQEARDLGERVAAARLARKLSKEGAARLSDVSTITYKRIEDGKSVRDTSLAQVLDALGLAESVSVSDEDEHQLLYRRPDGITDKKWREIVARTRNLVQWEIEQALKDQ
jgi:transcriptional regulator with XRE-family HTH domain